MLTEGLQVLSHCQNLWFTGCNESHPQGLFVVQEICPWNWIVNSRNKQLYYHISLDLSILYYMLTLFLYSFILYFRGILYFINPKEPLVPGVFVDSPITWHTKTVNEIFCLNVWSVLIQSVILLNVLHTKFGQKMHFSVCLFLSS